MNKGAGVNLVWRPGLAAARAACDRRVIELHAQGRRWYGGRPRGRWWRKPVNEQERAVRMIDDKLDTLPAPPDRPLEEWTIAEILGDNARLALLRQREILVNPITPEMDLKERRFIGETAAQAAKLAVRVQEASMRQTADDRWPELLKRVEQAKRQIVDERAEEKRRQN
jgi:hypothetical protein